jgi:hypothetical protein
MIMRAGESVCAGCGGGGAGDSDEGVFGGSASAQIVGCGRDG